MGTSRPRFARVLPTEHLGCVREHPPNSRHTAGINKSPSWRSRGTNATATQAQALLRFSIGSTPGRRRLDVRPRHLGTSFRDSRRSEPVALLLRPSLGVVGPAQGIRPRLRRTSGDRNRFRVAFGLRSPGGMRDMDFHDRAKRPAPPIATRLPLRRRPGVAALPELTLKPPRAGTHSRCQLAQSPFPAVPALRSPDHRPFSLMIIRYPRGITATDFYPSRHQ